MSAPASNNENTLYNAFQTAFQTALNNYKNKDNPYGLHFLCKESFEYHGQVCHPDFIIQSRGKSACVIVNAKNCYTDLGIGEVEKLCRDMRGAEKNGYGNCALGVLYCHDNTQVSSRVLAEANQHNILLHRESLTVLRNRINKTFYD